MSQFVPSWNMESTISSQKMPISGDDDLVELLWRNGQVVMQSQTNRKAQVTNKPENSPKPASSHQEDDTPSWFQYPFEDSLEKDLFSEFFSDIPSNTQDKSNKDLLMPPPKSSSYDEFARISKQQRTDTIEGGGLEESNVTIGSSLFRNNQKTLRRDLDLDLEREKLHSSVNDANLTCSSGRSGCSFGRIGNGNTGKGSTGNGSKRKMRDFEETASHSEDLENESFGVNKPDQQPASTRRSRAAEVHNLSERRRRDRINEKMKALQELIPHCNKTDKASMLDEAIEYLKSLQLQVQMMWMNGGMGPVMMPSVHQYMPRMGLGMPPVQMPRLPFVNQSMSATCPTNQNLLYPSPPFANQMPNVLGLNPMQMPHSQGMSFYPYGPQMVQQNQSTRVPNSVEMLRNEIIPPESARINK